MPSMNEFIATILASIVAFFGGGDMPVQEPLFGAPIQSIQRNIVPEADSMYYLGTTTPSTVAWASLITDQICLTGDTCRTTWPTGGGGGSGVFPFSSDTNFAQVVYSTSTPTLWFKSGVFASSTSWFTNITSTNATSTNATTTRLGITGIASSLLKTTSTGGVVAAVAGTDYQNYAFPFTTQTNFGTTTKATSTSIWSGGVFFSSSTVAASQFPYASSTAITVSGTASSTNLVVSGLNAANCDVKSSTSGVLSCGTDATGAGGAGAVATSSAETATRVPFWTSTAATPAALSGGSAGFTWNNTTSILTVTNATTTNLSASQSLYVGTNRVQDYETLAFSFATSTPGTGTTTRYLGPAAAALTLVSAQCDTSSFYRIVIADASDNRTNDFVASSTIGTVSLSGSNTFIAGESIRVSVGTTTAPSSSTNLACRIKYTYN